MFRINYDAMQSDGEEALAERVKMLAQMMKNAPNEQFVLISEGTGFCAFMECEDGKWKVGAGMLSSDGIVITDEMEFGYAADAAARVAALAADSGPGQALAAPAEGAKSAEEEKTASSDGAREETEGGR